MLATLAALLLFYSATTGVATSPATPTLPVATCSAIGKAQVETALGQSLEAAAPEFSKLESICDYTTGDVAIRIALQHLQQPLDLRAELATLKTAFPGSTITDVKGVGARAIALQVPEAGTQLHVLQGERDYLLVSVMGLGEGPRSFEVAAKLARAFVTATTR